MLFSSRSPAGRGPMGLVLCVALDVSSALALAVPKHALEAPMRAGAGNDWSPLPFDWDGTDLKSLENAVSTKLEDAVSSKQHLLEGCGEVCDTSIAGVKGKYFEHVRKHVDCMALFRNEKSDASTDVWPPPPTVPLHLTREFIMNGAVDLVYKNKRKPHGYYFAQQYSGRNTANVWSRDMLEFYLQKARDGRVMGNYAQNETQPIFKLLRKHGDDIRGKRLFVIGSETPWLEALLLHLGAEHVTTIEYSKIISEDPRVDVITPAELRAQFLGSNGTSPRFDGGATYSSIEHSGLGRYGDVPNPWADLQAVAKAWCYTKPGGSLFLGVPTARRDGLFWNAHREYGPKRWPHLMANWNQTDIREEPWLDERPEEERERRRLWKMPGHAMQTILAFQRDDPL